MAEHIRSH